MMRKISVLLISLFVVLMFLLFFLIPKKDFSENENRYLAEPPEFSAKNVFSGKFTDQTAAYLRDHFPFREYFLPVKTEYEKSAVFRSEVNGVYRSDDGFWIEKYAKPVNTERIISVLNSFHESIDVPANLMLVPTAFTVYAHKLPSYAESRAQTDEMYRIYDETYFDDIDVLETLTDLNSEDNLFYKSDHHWTTFAAYNAYCTFCRHIGAEPQKESDFHIYEATDSFLGTVYSKVNDAFCAEDSIFIYSQDMDITVEYPDKGIKTDTMYNEEYLSKKDKYSVFLDNLHPLAVITNNEMDSDKEIAVIKDSYANCFVPFLVKHYKKIHVFDTRYYKDSVSEYINTNSIDRVLILYNMNTIDTDMGITRIY